MAKPQRKTLIARVSPGDYDIIKSRAERETRSVGETLAIIVRENELMSRALDAAPAQKESINVG